METWVLAITIILIIAVISLVLANILLWLTKPKNKKGEKNV